MNGNSCRAKLSEGGRERLLPSRQV